MIFSAPGLMDIKASPKGSLQGMDLAGQPDRSALPGKNCRESDFFCMLKTAGLDENMAGMISENRVRPENLSTKDLQDWIMQLIGALQTSDCPECSLKEAIEEAESSGIFKDSIYSEDASGVSLPEKVPAPDIPGLSDSIEAISAAMQSEPQAGQLNIDDTADALRGLEEFLKDYLNRADHSVDNDPAQQLSRLYQESSGSGSDRVTDVLGDLFDRSADPAVGREVKETLRALINAFKEILQNGQTALRDAQNSPVRAGGGDGNLSLNGDFQMPAPETGGGLKDLAAGMTRDAARMSDAGQVVGILQELAEKNTKEGLKFESKDPLRAMMQQQDKPFAEPVPEQNIKNNEKTVSMRDPGSQNIQTVLESLVSGNMKKTENQQAVIRQSGAKSAVTPDLTTAGSAIFQKAENAASTVQPGGASFDTQLKAAESQVVNQVSVRLFTGVRQGSGSMTIQINPPELGSVKVKILSDQGSLSIQLNPQTQQVAAILERNLPALQQSLADQGFDVTGLEVGVDSGSDKDSPQFEDQDAGWMADGKNAQAGSLVDENNSARADHTRDQSSYAHGRGLSLRV